MATQVINSVPLLNSQGARPATMDNELEVARSELHQYSQAMLFAAILVLVSFWSAWYFPIILFSGAIFTGWVQFTHTKDYDCMMTNGCCTGPAKVFNYLYLLNVAGFLLSALCSLCGIVACISNIADNFAFGVFIFQCMFTSASLALTVLTFLSAKLNKMVDLQVKALLFGGGVPSAIVAGAAVAQQQAAQGYSSIAANGQPTPVTYFYHSQAPGNQTYQQQGGAQAPLAPTSAPASNYGSVQQGPKGAADMPM